MTWLASLPFGVLVAGWLTFALAVAALSRVASASPEAAEHVSLHSMLLCMYVRRGSPDAVLVASRALVGVAARSLAETEDTVTLVQYRALVLLAARGEMNVGTLAEALAVHQSTATRLCDRLVKRRTRRAQRAAAEPARGGRVARRARGTRCSGRSRRSGEPRSRRSWSASPRSERAAITDAFLLFADAAGEAPDDAWKLGWTT